MPLRALLAALVFAVACGQAIAADVIGYSEAFDTLYRVDLTTQTAVEVGRATQIGLPRLANIEGLTASPAGTLYAVSDTASVKTFLQINPTTGLATSLGVLTISGGNVSGQLDLSLAFTCDGRMWMASGTGSLWQVDPATATATFIGDLGAKITGLAARGNLLYGAGSQGNNNLYAIDTATGATTLIGSFGNDAPYITTISPAFDAAGNLHAILDFNPQPSGSTIIQWNDLAQITATSGALDDMGNITASGNSVADLEFVGMKGLAILPSACFAQQVVSSLPALSWPSLLLLIMLLTLITVTQFSRRYPTI
ncbi:MAG TPA: hypothetical protein VHW73_08435 [Rudaea sp.]|nr:hypothetical protein [Rudaea sp.]